MGHIPSTHRYYQSIPGRKPAYRGIVRVYNGTPTVEQYQCQKARYSQFQALKDAKKLITTLKINNHANT